MWYKKDIRRHLCDMHINDWDPSFLSQLSPYDYVENLKVAKIQNAMLYYQSHVGLCYFPTKSGKMHSGFIGKEDTMRRIGELCHENGISVTGYYSLIYNNWAHDNHPEWRMVDETGVSQYEKGEVLDAEFAHNDLFRYGLCCPNNPGYRDFVSAQIKEIADYFEFDGMFFDMLFWPHMCYCDSCKKRWEKEVGGEIPTKEDWNDPKWLLHIQKRREWMGQFAQSVTDEMKAIAPHTSVEHNFACAILADGRLAIAEPVNDACDYVGGDLYGGIYRQSFTCKFYRNITKNQPFEYMFSRCEPNLSAHTQLKSMDVMRSSVFMTTAHHGATLVIDAIDPVGTLDKRVYDRIGQVFAESQPYEQYYDGDMLEDVGIYYTLRSKFNSRGEPYTNHLSAVTTSDTMIFNNIPYGVTGGFYDINKYKLLIAPCLTDEDEYDNERIIEYVRSGGHLYFSGAENSGLLKAFFRAEKTGYTKERVTYISPNSKAQESFDYFTEKYPLHFDGAAPIVVGIKGENILASITLPGTHQDTLQFVSIHSNPPCINTDIPAMAECAFGKGRVLWSAVPIECGEQYDTRRVFLNLLTNFLELSPMLTSDAPKDVEIVTFNCDDYMLLSTVVMNMDYKARKIEDFYINIKSEKTPKSVTLLPTGQEIDFTFENGILSFESKDLKIFKMYKIQF